MTPADEREGECPKTTGFCRMPRKLHDMVCKDCGCVYVSDDHFEDDDGPESNQWAIQYAEHCNVAHLALAAAKEREERLEACLAGIYAVSWDGEVRRRAFAVLNTKARRALSEAEGKKP